MASSPSTGVGQFTDVMQYIVRSTAALSTYFGNKNFDPTAKIITIDQPVANIAWEILKNNSASLEQKIKRKLLACTVFASGCALGSIYLWKKGSSYLSLASMIAFIGLCILRNSIKNTRHSMLESIKELIVNGKEVEAIKKINEGFDSEREYWDIARIAAAYSCSQVLLYLALLTPTAHLERMMNMALRNVGALHVQKLAAELLQKNYTTLFHLVLNNENRPSVIKMKEALQSEGTSHVAKIAFDLGAEPFDKPENWQDILNRASVSLNDALIRLLLAHGARADANIRDYDVWQNDLDAQKQRGLGEMLGALFQSSIHHPHYRTPFEYYLEAYLQKNPMDMKRLFEVFGLVAPTIFINISSTVELWRRLNQNGIRVRKQSCESLFKKMHPELRA